MHASLGCWLLVEFKKKKNETQQQSQQILFISAYTYIKYTNKTTFKLYWMFVCTFALYSWRVGGFPSLPRPSLPHPLWPLSLPFCPVTSSSALDLSSNFSWTDVHTWLFNPGSSVHNLKYSEIDNFVICKIWKADMTKALVHSSNIWYTIYYLYDLNDYCTLKYACVMHVIWIQITHWPFFSLFFIVRLTWFPEFILGVWETIIFSW